MEQNLYNKTIIWNGDSICCGNRGIAENERDCWASRIAASNFTRTEELPFGRMECIQISLLLSWLIGALLTFMFYKRGKWKNKAI